MEEKYNYKTVELIKEWVENDGRTFRIPSPYSITANVWVYEKVCLDELSNFHQN